MYKQINKLDGNLWFDNKGEPNKYYSHLYPNHATHVQGGGGMAFEVLCIFMRYSMEYS